MKRFGIAAGLCLALLACALPATASAGTMPVVLQIESPDGTRIIVSGQGALSYPRSGRLVQASVAEQEGALVFSGLSLLGGRVTADQLVVPVSGTGEMGVASLRVDGKAGEGLPNEVIPLADGGYVIALQEAVDGSFRALAGLHIHLGARAGRLKAGTDILIGVPSDSLQAANEYAYPLAEPAVVIGCPFALGSTHSPFIAPDNLASDNAIDLAVPYGTPVYAVAAGIIGPQIGALDSRDPRMAGLRVHLDTPGVHFYYAHLSRIDVQPGQYVEAGQQLGLSGEANGSAHLHFAEDVGNPAETVGATAACPLYEPYLEPWG